MPVTKVSDILVPEIWDKYFQEKTAELSAIRNSGIAGSVGITVPQGGSTIKMPFWNDIQGESEVWTSGTATVPGKISASKDIAAILTRIKSWGAEDLAGLFAGSDPMAAIGNMVGSWWARDEQKIVLSILKGIFASATMADNLVDKSTQAIDNTLMVDALAALGDHSQNIAAIVMHSATMFDLSKKKLLDPKPTEPGSSTAPEFQTYLGRRIIVDDGCPVDDVNVGTELAPEMVKVFTTYLFGTGAIGYAEGSPKTPVEVERKGTESTDILINRRQFIFHPRGVKWIGTPAADTPSNAELATGANWSRVYENKNIPIIALKHKIG